MNKFKTGDRVRYVGKGFNLEGKVGVVLEDDSVPFVEWEDFDKGHDALFNDGRKSVYAITQDSLEAEKQMKFEIGDEVTGVNYKEFLGKFGIVVDVDEAGGWYDVMFENEPHSWYVLEENLDFVVYPEDKDQDFDPETFVMEITTYWV